MAEQLYNENEDTIDNNSIDEDTIDNNSIDEDTIDNNSIDDETYLVDNNIFQDMFAYRISLEDEYTNESLIIKELKIYLLNVGIPRNEIDNKIFEFYKYYRINISLEFIENIRLTSNIFNQIVNQLFRSANNSSNIENNGSSMLNNIISIIQNTLDNEQEEFQDVVVTVDDNDLEKLSKTIVTNNMDIDCSICLSNLQINEEIIELNCTHKFHSECILTYLKEYNYKCPVCRIQIGKPKYNL